MLDTRVYTLDYEPDFSDGNMRFTTNNNVHHIIKGWCISHNNRYVHVLLFNVTNNFYFIKFLHDLCLSPIRNRGTSTGRHPELNNVPHVAYEDMETVRDME